MSWPPTISSINKHRPVVTQRWKKTNERHRCPCIDPSTHLTEISNLNHYSRMYRQAYPVSCTYIRKVMILVVLQEDGSHMSSICRS